MGNEKINVEVTNSFSSYTYIKNASEKIKKLFETKLKNYGSPLEGGYHI